ncbi:Bug family tripartite tricarboxylate transporter substrate binding protein [Siccirubricoccus phaeus]|uniref:Bug family tripartite tricarboxylate transporter substrate binding protein n=1 Tax=Siccirubricoccus phaeus TaxID=2595053 RepID=UPI00165AD9AE|nr:tripartite tricarboxylate transporter substrate binding protein [Siccirubricoccus phaeus]
MHRRTLLGATAMLALPRLARAASFPDGPITLIVAWPAGGGSDVSMRLVAEAASKRLGVPVVVENRPGAAGTIGHRAIAAARPDGQTIGMVSQDAISAQYGNANAPAMSEFEPLAFFGEEPGALQVHPSTGITTLAQYIERAKANPGKIRNGGNPAPGASYLYMAYYERKLGIRVTKVSYAGYAPTVTALLSGEVDSASVPVPDVVEYHKEGRLKLLAVAGEERHFMAPDVPTFRELGHDVVIGGWRSLAAPVGVPADRLAVLRRELFAAFRDPELQAKARQAGFVMSPGDAARTAAAWAESDTGVYPILDELGLVKARRKQG